MAPEMLIVTIWMLVSVAYTQAEPQQRRIIKGLQARRLKPPIVINTWNFTDANIRAWQELSLQHSALDAIEFGTGQCEIDRCDGTVGWGGSPSESGETTLDAMIMDGETYDVGAVGALRRIRGASRVARLVLERTNHTLLVGDMATKFALQLGFKEESLESKKSRQMHQEWLNNSCQPNYWRNVEPDPRKFCGPYKLIALDQSGNLHEAMMQQPGKVAPLRSMEEILTVGHDTIGMVAMDSRNRLASGTSTNGLRYKIAGRVGDSPVPGAGSYADRSAGAAAATGDGDVMMRFLLSYQSVENMRIGMTPLQAAEDVIERQIRRTGRPYAHAAVIVLSKDGAFGAACCGYKTFPFVISDAIEQYRTYEVNCMS